MEGWCCCEWWRAGGGGGGGVEMDVEVLGGGSKEERVILSRGEIDLSPAVWMRLAV